MANAPRGHICDWCGFWEDRFPVFWSCAGRSHVFCDNDCLKEWIEAEARAAMEATQDAKRTK